MKDQPSKGITLQLYLFWYLSTDGSVVEFSPATREARVRFPVSASFFSFFSIEIDFLSFFLFFNREDVVAALNNAIDNREEGIIVKLPSSTYKPDKRKGEVIPLSTNNYYQLPTILPQAVDG